MATSTEVKAKLLDEIHATASMYSTPADMLKLAEAYAWVVNSGQPHGGQAGAST